MSQMANGMGQMQPPLPPGIQPPLPPGIPGQMAPGFPWNGSYQMMGDMGNMMFNNQALMMQNQPGMMQNQPSMMQNQPSMMQTNQLESSNGRSNRNRRHSRSMSQSPEPAEEHRGGKRKAEDKLEADNSMQMNPMMGMMSNMMPMGSGMFPMMGGFAPLPAPNLDTASMELLGQTQMELMNNAGGDVNMMMPVVDPSMIGMAMGITMGSDMKELVLNNCKLTPPPIGTPLPPRRPKPPGCRTIFIGGLPEKINEDNVREIFGRFGRIYTLRLSKKNFCHIRYERETCVDMAIALSGYKLKIYLTDKPEEEVEDKSNTGWLHVDFAFSRDDQNDFERKQKRLEREAERAAEREASAREYERPRSRDRDRDRDSGRSRRVERKPRSPSPIRVQPYSSVISAQIAEKIRSEENFASAVPTLIAWLERGECQKKNAMAFYSMIQAANGQIRRLFNEKMQVDEELQQAKDKAKNQYQSIITQLEQVAKVLTAASHQRVWDHFSKPQRKNIETWKKMTEEFQTIKEEITEKFKEDEEMGEERSDNSELKKLKREKENILVQLEAYKNEVDLLKADSMSQFEKWKAQFIATQALQNMADNKPPPPPPLVKPPPPPPTPDDGQVKLTSTVEPGCGEARLIGVMSAFLQVHPRGASLDYVISYVRAQLPTANSSTVRRVLERHPDVFTCSTSGVGADIERRWKFSAFC